MMNGENPMGVCTLDFVLDDGRCRQCDMDLLSSIVSPGRRWHEEPQNSLSHEKGDDDWL